MSASALLKERLRRQTGDARLRQAAVEEEIDRRAGRPPDPGDLVIFSETSEHDVEWAILERDPRDPRRLLAVPADIYPLAGSADVAVAGGPRGALTLRCGHGVWIDAEALAPGHRTGFLSAEDLDRARRTRAAFERGSATGSVLARDVDGETDYLDLVEELERAREAVPRRQAAAEREPGPSAGGAVVPFGRPPWWGSASSLLAVAASILLVLTLGLARELARSARQQEHSVREHEAVVTEQRQALARLEDERRRLAESHAQDLARLEDERQRLDSEHRQRIAELEAASRPGARINLPLLILAAGQLRSAAADIEVAPDASSLMLILQVEDPDAYPRYRLEITESDGGRRVWSDSGLTPSRLSELTVLLPRGLVPDGSYQLRLYGLRGDRPARLMERMLRIESASRAPTRGVEDR